MKEKPQNRNTKSEKKKKGTSAVRCSVLRSTAWGSSFGESPLRGYKEPPVETPSWHGRSTAKKIPLSNTPLKKSDKKKCPFTMPFASTTRQTPLLTTLLTAAMTISTLLLLSSLHLHRAIHPTVLSLRHRLRLTTSAPHPRPLHHAIP